MLTLPTRRTLAFWRSCLGSALRTSLACAIIACAKLYGPAPLRRQLAFTAFTYVTAIQLVNDTTLGEVVSGATHVMCGTLQGVLPAILSLWLIGPARFSITTTTLAVSLSAFVVALPESTHVISKRIALGQIVLVYVSAFMHGVRTEAVMEHPVHVAVSTGFGVLASLLALLLPYPRIGHKEVKEKSKRFAEVVSDKLKHFVNAFCAENNASALASISQAKSLENTGKDLLRCIKLKQDSIPWERPSMKFMAHLKRPSERLSNLEIPLKGMEMALTSCPSLPTKILNEELKGLLLSLTEGISQTLRRPEYPQNSNSSTVPETEKQVPHKPLQVAFPTHQDLPSLFFIFCMKFLHNQSVRTDLNLENNPIPVKEPANSRKQETNTKKNILTGWSIRISSERFLVAFKCSLSLGLAVLFGLLFSKENGYWAGLTVALAMAPWREATFKAANIRAQGTVLGSVYGVLGCLISQKFMEFRVLLLFPWIVFTSFLRRSRMYGMAGGVSATVGAILLLGRRGYGLPSDFAIARITETFIGLCCSIFVELLLQPTRASTLARIQVSECLGALHECIEFMGLDANVVDLKEREKKLRKHIDKLAKYIEEAGEEPNFWFVPFPTACYEKMLVSLSKMVEHLVFVISGMEFLVHESHTFGVVWNDLQEHVNGDLELLKVVCSSMKCLEEITRIKSVERLEMELQRKNKRKSKSRSDDLEMEKSSNENGFRILSADEEEIEKIVGSFLQHAKEDLGRTHVGENEERKCNVVLCLSAIGFCMGGLMRETREIEKGVKEILQLESHSCHIN